MKRFINFLLLAFVSFNALAASNSNPGLTYGYIPTAAQWNSYFSAKLDYSPGPADSIPYWDASGNLRSALVSGSCTASAGVFNCATSNLSGGALGSFLYQTSPTTTGFLAGNVTTTPYFLTSTGTGAAAQAPTLTASTGTGSVVLASGTTGTGNAVLASGATVSNITIGTSSLNGVLPAHKSFVNNGRFQIAQAGTSFAAPASGAYDLDGWLNTNTSTGVFTVAQATGSSAEKLSRTVTITTADAAVAVGDLISDDDRIEGYDITDLVGQTFTVSFWAKFPVTGIHCVALSNSGIDRSYVHEINVATANTWAQYSFTVTGGLPTAGTWNYTNGIGLRLHVTHMAGSTYQTTADSWNTGNFYATANQVNDAATVSNAWGLQDVRIDLGTQVGSDWPSYQEALAKAQRYRVVYAGDGVASVWARGFQNSTSQWDATGIFPVPMRAAPTASYVNLTSIQLLISGGSNQSITTITYTATSTAGFRVYGNTGAVGSQGWGLFLYNNAGSQAIFDATL